MFKNYNYIKYNYIQLNTEIYQIALLIFVLGDDAIWKLNLTNYTMTTIRYKYSLY